MHIEMLKFGSMEELNVHLRKVKPDDVRSVFLISHANTWYVQQVIRKK